MARAFNGTTQYLEGVGVPIATLPLALVGWVNVANTTGLKSLLALADPDGDDHYGLSVYDDAGCGDIFGPGSKYVLTANTLTANTWHHVAAIYTTTVRRYAVLDGDVGNMGLSTELREVSDLSHVSVAGFSFNSSRLFYLTGRTAELAVFDLAGYPGATNDAKSLAFMNLALPSLAAGYSPQFAPGLVAYWPLGGLKGQHDNDIVGGFDMTPVNTPTWADHPPVIYPSGPRVVVPSGTVVVPPQLFQGAAA